MQKQFAKGEVEFRMFLSCRILRTGFLSCVFAVVFCVSDAAALPEVELGGSGGSSSSGETTSTTTSGIAGVSYVKDVVATKESTTNKVTSLTSSATNTQYPSALAVYSAVSERVSTSSAASQSMAGTYNVTGTLSVPDLPLPSEE